MSLAITNTSPRISRQVARLQAQSSCWLAWVLLVMHMNVNTVEVGCLVKWCAFHLVGCYLNTLMLQLMARAARLCHIFKWGREMKKVGNHCSKTSLHLWEYVLYSLRGGSDIW